MSSTITTSRPSTPLSRSLRTCTWPDDLRARAVARDRHEIERGRSGKLAREIGHEDECALEDADKVDAVGMIAVDLLRERADALLNVVGGDQDVHREVN